MRLLCGLQGFQAWWSLALLATCVTLCAANVSALSLPMAAPVMCL